jgi:phosphopantetheinyl transferase (holo-ACP synthase)
MQSAGNDIIALNLVNEQRGNDSRFYSKILSECEQLYYRRSISAVMGFTHFLWLCWSVKESAYKYLKRIHPGLVFSPSRILIRHITVPADTQLSGITGRQWKGDASDKRCYNGSFTAEGNIYYFRSCIYSELITTVVSGDENFEHVFWDFSAIDDTSADHQSEAVRSFLLQKLHTILSGKELAIKKASAGYPVIVQGTEELAIPVSFAHHGRFIAYSFLLHSNA